LDKNLIAYLTKQLSLTVWFLCAILILFCAATQITLETQQVMSAVIISSLFLLKWINPSGQLRVLFIYLCIFIALRYFFWRTFYTIPTLDTPFSFIFGMQVYLAEVYAFLVFLLGVFVNIAPMSRPLKSLPPPDADIDLPTVDILIPSYNESGEILEMTVRAALNMDYPEEKRRVYLLDDGGTEEKCHHPDPQIAEEAQARRSHLSELCRRLGCHYMTRTHNTHAKAGNLNAAFAVTDGDLIVVFDADHVPTTDFLARTIPHFLEDPKLFLVQTPHFFMSGDPVERNLQTFSTMPSENEMFYAVIQKGLDRWNAAFFCGSAAVLKRTALEQAGGFKGDSVTEDCETALDLHRRGYNSRYVDRPMIAGLQPETMVDFIGQRARWARGMVQLFVLKNPLLIKGLTFQQRICYLSSMSFWFFGFARLSFVMAPLLFLIFDLKIFTASGTEFVSFAVPYLCSIFILSDFIYGRVRWPFISELYEYIQSIFLIRVITRVFLNPRSGKFNVTNKGTRLDKNHMSPVATPFLVVIGLMLVGVGASVYWHVIVGEQQSIYTIVTIWNAANLFIALASLGAVFEHRQMRGSPRMPMMRTGRLHVGGLSLDALIVDGSMTGVQVQVPTVPNLVDRLEQADGYLEAPDPAGQKETLWIPVVPRNVRIRGAKATMGTQFNARTEVERRDIVSLIFADSEHWCRFLEKRRRRLGVVTGIFFFLGLSVRYAFYALMFLAAPSRHRQTTPAPPKASILQAKLTPEAGGGSTVP